MKFRFLLAALAALLVVPSPSTAQNTTNGLLPGDVVLIDIWREDDLSGRFVVDENGEVILPLLGRKAVIGIGPDELRAQLTEDYSQYLVNTAVNVTLLRRINVLGEVNVPGQYEIDATQSIAGVIAQAQGITSEGNSDDIRLLRNGQITRTDLNGTLTLADAGIRSGDQIVVGRRSWLSRNFQSLVGVGSIVANIIVIVTR